ncbi:hypothetical protein HNQ56_004009 [Anaerotaenia torta]|uniref:glycosyl hydrolase n=1 Tax=Anaerotaenia torta TaxID=433293 RepID=UPI003D1C9DD3
MKKTKIFSFAVAVCMLLTLITTMPVSAAEEGTVSATEWQKDAVVYPAQEQLIPAGPVWVKWNTVQNAVRYIVYLDDKPGVAVNATSGSTIEYEVYTVDVNTHTVWIEAELTNGQKVLTKPRTFYVSKKGIGFFNDLSNMQNMNLSWYYTWNATKSNQAVVEKLDFTPMFWNGQCNPGEIAGYKTVLGCNEPDHTGQVNTPATTVARSWWPSFVDSGKRTGSPAAAWEYENKPGQWLYDFMELIKRPDGSYPVDFITVHSYPGWPGDTDGGDQIADFKALIEDLWNRYHKPIWITEFAVANWPSNQDDIQPWGYTKQHVYNYMDKLLDYLDNCPYVERYAWFSFGDPDGNPYGESAGSHAALTTRTTGVLTRLGELYRDKGNPQKRSVSDSAVPGSLGGTVSCIINVSAGTGGTVMGGGTYSDHAQVTLTARPNEHYLFDGWYAGSTKVSDNPTYLFTAIASMTLQARFKVDPANPPPVPVIHIYDPDNVFGGNAFVYSGIWINQWLEMSGPWPGIPLQKNNGWLTFEMDLETVATFILNDGSFDAATQIKYVWDEGLHNKTDLYFAVDKDALAYQSDGGSKKHYLTQYKTREAALRGGGTAPGGPVLNIYDPTNQLGSNPYWYGLDTNWWEWPAGSYPGASLTKSADGWFSLEYDLNVLNAIIFNNGTESVKYVWSRDRHKFNEYWLVVDPTAPTHVVDNGTVERFLIPYTSKAAALAGGGTEPGPGRGGPVDPDIPPDPDPDPSGDVTNVALGKMAATNRPGNGAASYGVDGDANTRFESEHGGNYELIYTVDLGANCSVSQIAINWEAMTTTATKFKIETATSENGLWTEVYTKNSGAAEQVFRTTFNAVTARYVKLTATEKEGPWGYSFWEFEVYGTGGQASSANVARGKTASTNRPGNGAASYGIDGSSNTRFESEHGGNYELTYTIDLGSTFSVNKIAILWEAVTTTATKFKIETAASENGPWTTVYTKSGGDPVMDFETSFAAVNARYVKLTAYEKTGPWGYSFWEFEVYGR